MTKQEMIDAIETASQIHKDQMQKVRIIVKGEDVDEPTPLGKMECACGQWFYGNKEIMIKIFGHQLFERLDKLHTQWHEEYAKIYEIYFEHQKRKEGEIGKLFFQNLSEKQRDELHTYYKALKEVTQSLMDVTQSALRRVHALQNAKFETL